MRLQDKVIIVTGSTTGIGRAIAERVVKEGARVLVHGRNRTEGAAVVAGLDGNAVLHIDDLADPDSPARIVQAALQAFGQIDGLVNNAAYIPRSTLESTSAAFFDRELARWRQFGLEPLFDRWRAAAHPVGAPLSVHGSGGERLVGTFAGLEPDGALRLRLADGAVHVIHAGDVTVEGG